MRTRSYPLNSRYVLANDVERGDVLAIRTPGVVVDAEVRQVEFLPDFGDEDGSVSLTFDEFTEPYIFALYERLERAM